MLWSYGGVVAEGSRVLEESSIGLETFRKRNSLQKRKVRRFVKSIENELHSGAVSEEYKRRVS